MAPAPNSRHEVLAGQKAPSAEDLAARQTIEALKT
jgi:hypothetical protein